VQGCAGGVARLGQGFPAVRRQFRVNSVRRHLANPAANIIIPGGDDVARERGNKLVGLAVGCRLAPVWSTRSKNVIRHLTGRSAWDTRPAGCRKS
jgi:hypothetical protein